MECVLWHKQKPQSFHSVCKSPNHDQGTHSIFPVHDIEMTIRLNFHASVWRHRWSFPRPVRFPKQRARQAASKQISHLYHYEDKSPALEKHCTHLMTHIEDWSSAHSKQNETPFGWIKTGRPKKETLGPCQSWHHTSVCTYDASLNCAPSINTLLSSGQTCLNLTEYWQDDIVNDLHAKKPLPFAWPFLLHEEWFVSLQASAF